jgi:hypothetical protein
VGTRWQRMGTRGTPVTSSFGFARRESVQIDGISLNIIGLTDFKTNKRAAGRLKDRADLESLDGPPKPA